MTEFTIEPAPYAKDIWYLTYTPSNPKYNSFRLWSDYKGNTPYSYKFVEDNDVVIYFNHRSAPHRMEGIYFEQLKHFLIDKMKIDLIPIIDTSYERVTDVLEKAKISYYRIQYHHTRTIERAHQRPVLAYAVSFGSAVLFFKKRGGILCYHIGTIGLGYRYSWSTASCISLKNGLQLLDYIKQYKLGKVYLPRKSKQEIIDTMILEKI